jgi:hypothetical protein
MSAEFSGPNSPKLMTNAPWKGASPTGYLTKSAIRGNGADPEGIALPDDPNNPQPSQSEQAPQLTAEQQAQATNNERRNNFVNDIAGDTVGPMVDSRGLIRAGVIRDATQFQPPPGGGIITGEADENGIRKALGVVPTDDEMARAQAGALGQGQGNGPRDVFGNDMSRTLDMQRQLGDLQFQNALSNINSKSPRAQAEGRQTMASLLQRGAIGSRANTGEAINPLELAKFKHTVRKDAEAAHNTRIQKFIEEHAPITAKEGPEREAQTAYREEFTRALMGAYGGNFPSDPTEFEATRNENVAAAKLLMNLNALARQPGYFNTAYNLANNRRLGGTPGYSMSGIDLVHSNDDYVRYNGYDIPVNALIAKNLASGSSGDELNYYAQYIKSPKAQKARADARAEARARSQQK